MGNSPIFEETDKIGYVLLMRVSLAPSGLREADIDSINRVLRSGNLTMGSEVLAFEKEMARYLGVKHFIMVNSGSSANLAMVEALLRPTSGTPKLKVGDGVLVPAIAWPTTVWPLIQLGLKPIFVDVDEETMALDLVKAQKIVDEKQLRVLGLFPIHPLGFAIPRAELQDFCKKNNLVLIEDACESLGSWDADHHSGTAGLMSSFSFYFSHHITTMEGGGVATNEGNLADDIRSIRSHGWSRDRSDSDKWSPGMHPSMRKFNFVSTGFNIRPMEIQAAVGQGQLKDLEVFVQRRREIVNRVANEIAGTNLRILGLSRENRVLARRDHSWMHIPIQININGSEVTEKYSRVIKFLEDFGVETRPPLTGNFVRQPAMLRYAPYVTQDSVPVADKISKSVFLVGCHHDLSDDQIDHLSTKLRQAALEIL